MSHSPIYSSDSDSPAKQRILSEGLRLFTANGIAETSIRDIGKAAGYTNPALYKHFKSKDDLALRLFEACYHDQLIRLERAVSHATGFEQRLHAYLGCSAALFDEDPNAVMYVSNNLANFWPEVQAKYKGRTMITVTREIITEGRREGLVSTRHDIELQVTLIVGTLGQLTRQLFLGSMKGPATDLIKHIEPILRAGLR